MAGDNIRDGLRVPSLSTLLPKLIGSRFRVHGSKVTTV
jgi:hypothetical protein